MAQLLLGTTAWRGASRAGTGSLFRLDDTKQGWTQAAEMDCGVQAFARDTRTGRLFAATGDGIWRSDGQGERWERSGRGSERRAVWSLLILPDRPDTVLAGLSPRGILRSEDGGDIWREAAVDAPAQTFDIADDGVTRLPFPARVTGLAADRSDGNVLFAAVEVEGMWRSIDGGRTWQDSSAALLALADSPHLQARIGRMDGRKSMADGHAITTLAGSVFYANRLGLFRSDDRGKSWEDVRLDRFSPITYVRSVVASASEPEALYATLSVRSGGETGTIWKSADRGETWTRLDHAIEPDSTMMAVTVHPANPRIVFGTDFNGHVFGTQDGGRSWRGWAGPAGATESYALLSF